MLDSPDPGFAESLATRLAQIDDEVRHLRHQQRVILDFLDDRAGSGPQPFLTAARFVELLDLAGVTPAQRARWHAAYEDIDPGEHQAFLEFLCLPDDAIDHIRDAGR